MFSLSEFRLLKGREPVVELRTDWAQRMDAKLFAELQEHVNATIVNAFAIPPRYLMPFNAVRVIEDRTLVDMVEDWSRVRSPSRAERRRRLGHRQNITMVAVPNKTVYSLDHGRTLIMHPAVAAVLRHQIEPLRCLVTGNPCGTDTWMAGQPCRCAACRTG